MRLTTKGRFAVTAMIDIALHGRSGPVTLASISLRQRVSLSYLELLFAKLRRNDLVESTRGPGGGYSLSRKAALISVADIVLSIEDHGNETTRRRAGADVDDSGRCEVEELWASVNLRAVEFLKSISLQSLVDEQKAKGVQAATSVAGSRRTTVVGTPVRKPFVVDAPNSVFALGRRQQRAS
ncbi:Rrf2 family iron-sulfur cluster assembly transcriptional regulator [Variovorax boronicumulans]|uniref:Rrf2 family transcriptional regulator n=1 Tax=Variovorax TaxID=34072 RepID=UPI00278A0EA5|nr:MULTISPECIES: Rrf2 family transcriptional regulator [Variovorax]MDP9990314.1 Rrf2 family iron-sulfur cluster assembly transcriptional regulator [Variovorax boronicumulans]MDQ0001176.1 Rrf2 family iron-sulfur cluster assembly transcriptional regulator [Variovorax boronicumulans]MDQ0033600.1 Rrf2 family iron-sulfur cluster assembly transcriptional regulator [Variovorax boronicumulans]MDQ0606397.1 Rrf2 family iron-sulfur cluster assembly transcriptional regulator [Variovorax sp. W1I1]